MKFFIVTSKSLIPKLKGLERRQFIPSTEPTPKHHLFNMPIYVSIHMYTRNICSDSKYLVQVQRHESTLSAIIARISGG